MEPLVFQPIYQQRVWGGHKLDSLPGRSLPDDQPYGESWEIVDRPEAQSLLASGSFGQGLSLRHLIEKYGASIMGPDYPADRPFPILVKWLDCQDRLSLQVHPPASIAPELGGEPKTENWYIAEAEPHAALIVGLAPGTTRQAFEEALAGERLEPCLNRFTVKPGDSVFVRSGRLHAIDGGNLILEIQQNSDTTYRVYDWGRVGLDGKPRQLHIEESLASIDFEDFAPDYLKAQPGSRLLVDAAEFRLCQEDLSPGHTLTFSAGEQPRIINVVQGELKIGDTTYPYGSTLLLPFGGTFVLSGSPQARVLVTDRFT
jgi:mannose-6-phosphate isomerase